MPHDLRRTYVSLADELELDQNVIKNLVNHHNADITERDLLLLILFTGLPVKEAMTLKWSQVCLNDGTMTIFQGNIVHVIPLPEFIWMILNVRHFGALNEFVFRGTRGEHILNSSASFQTVKRRSGVQFDGRDLKSTFKAVCKELKIDDPYKFMAGRSEARLRRSMSQIAKTLLGRCGVSEVPLT
jgi:integrase